MKGEFDRWVGADEHNGIPSLTRPDAPKATTWSLAAIALVERPHDAVLSPDGESVALVVDRDMSDIWVIPVDGGVPSRVTTGRELTAYWEDDRPAWSPDGSRIAFSANGHVWTVDLAGGLAKKVVEGSSPIWASDEELIVTVERDEESRLARVSSTDPWPQGLTPPGMNVSSASVSADRRLLAFLCHPKDDRQGSEVWLLDMGTGDSRKVSGETGMRDGPPTISRNNQAVAFTSERAGWNEIFVVAVDGEGLRQVTTDEADFSALAWNDDNRRLVAGRTRRGITDLVVVDTQTGMVEVLAEGGSWSPVGWGSGRRVVAIHESHDTPPRLVVVGDTGEVGVLLDSAPASVRAATHRNYEEITFESRDGMEIHGFLFRPDVEAGTQVPAVVYPHGGPTSAYGDEWDGHAQYFIERGYAWLAINFRGSTGYGRDFERANYGAWGVSDTEDCLAAAAFLAELDWVDGSRIAIFGASYGSYLALASLARDPEHRFACGVAKYGDSDIATSWAQGDRVGREDLERMMGKPSESRVEYREGSPLGWVTDIEAPLLVAHGEKDERVHPDQSGQLVARLKEAGKTYEYVTYPTEGHGLLRFAPQVHFYRRLERFLDWYLM